jgi:excinuclease ABC subunit B
MKLDRKEITRQLVSVQYERNEMEFKRGCFRLRGAHLDIFPADAETAWRVQLDETVESIKEIDPLTGDTIRELGEIWVFPATHFVSTSGEVEQAAGSIEKELAERLAVLKGEGKLLEAERLGQRVRYDLEMIRQTGYCAGVENYARHLAVRPPGSRPDCLFDYFKDDFLLFIDESHVTVPQIRGMYEGDRARKQTLVDFGFRLPSALDNRPLKFAEFEAIRPATVFVSATPGPYELKTCSKEDIVEQIIRPTGLIDPEVKILPVTGQIKALTAEIEVRAAKKERTLVLTLTKKTAEDLAAYLGEKGLKARYMHSDMDTLERLDILGAFRKGEFDALVGINLLREGLDIPEVTLVAILNADNEGFLRSETTLIQISGRAARNMCGEVILFADRMTGSMERALAEMTRRRKKQVAYNKKHGIEPKSIIKKFVEYEELRTQAKRQGISVAEPLPKNFPKSGVKAMAAEIESRMKDAADNLNFELATELRDRLYELREMTGVKIKGAGRRGKK